MLPLPTSFVTLFVDLSANRAALTGVALVGKSMLVPTVFVLE